MSIFEEKQNMSEFQSPSRNITANVMKEWEEKVTKHGELVGNIFNKRKYYYSLIKKYRTEVMDNEYEKIRIARILDVNDSLGKVDYLKAVNTHSLNTLKLSAVSIDDKDVPYVKEKTDILKNELDELFIILNAIENRKI